MRKNLPRGGTTTRFFFRSTALLVCICLLFSDHALYGAISQRPVSISVPNVSIPTEFGRVEEFHEGVSGKTIVFIQDAHDSLEAQENIARTINHLDD